MPGSQLPTAQKIEFKLPQFNVKFDFRGPTTFAKPEEGKATGLPNPFT
jgi:hypothetical protein